MLVIQSRVRHSLGSELCAENEKVTTPRGSVHTHTNMLKGTGDTLRVLGVG